MGEELTSAEELLQAYIGLSEAWNYIGMTMKRQDSLKEELSEIREGIWQAQKTIIEIRNKIIERTK